MFGIGNIITEMVAFFGFGKEESVEDKAAQILIKKLKYWNKNCYDHISTISADCIKNKIFGIDSLIGDPTHFNLVAGRNLIERLDTPFACLIILQNYRKRMGLFFDESLLEERDALLLAFTSFIYRWSCSLLTEQQWLELSQEEHVSVFVENYSVANGAWRNWLNCDLDDCDLAKYA